MLNVNDDILLPERSMGKSSLQVGWRGTSELLKSVHRPLLRSRSSQWAGISEAVELS